MNQTTHKKTIPSRLVAFAGKGFGYNKLSQIYPPYGKMLADRQRLNKKLLLVVVCTGQACWKRAKKWHSSGLGGLVLLTEQNPSNLQWPVKDCPCLVEWGGGISEKVILELVTCLLKAGAAFVSVIPMFVNHNEVSEYFDLATHSWVKTRQSMKTYSRKVASYVAR